MESDGWVESQLVVQDNRPDKKVYAITAAGHETLAAWLAQPSPPEQLRSEFTVKLRALHLVDRDVLLESVVRRRAGHATTLAAYEASAKKSFPDPSALTDDQLGPYLALRGGIRLERSGLDWCDEIIRTLEDR
jgi:hypothetical protein